MDLVGLYCHAGCPLSDGSLQHNSKSVEIVKEENNMPIVIAVAATPLACFAEGAILGASVYRVSRGYKNLLRTSKK